MSLQNVIDASSQLTSRAKNLVQRARDASAQRPAPQTPPETFGDRLTRILVEQR